MSSIEKDIEHIVSEAITATTSSSRLQQMVRDVFINYTETESSSMLCDIASEYRDKMDSWIGSPLSKEDQKLRRKQVNNVINDLSRLARKHIGKSIVAVNRGVPYKYEAQDPKPRAKEDLVPAPSPVTLEQLDDEIVSEEVLTTWGAVRKACRDNPESVIDRLFDETGDVDVLGVMFLDRLKQYKAVNG